MEAIGAIGSGLLMWLAAFVLTGGSLTLERPRVRALRGRLGRRFLRTLRALGSMGVTDLLLGKEYVRALCRLIERHQGHRLGLRSLEEACGLLEALLVLASLSCAMLARSPLGLTAPVLGAACALPIWHSSRTRRQRQQLAAEMPGVFRTLAMAMGSGETLTQAVEYVGNHERGLAGEAFGRAALRLRCGMSSRDALEALVGELDAPGVGLLATALLISQRTGSPLRGLFQHSARLVEREGEFERMLSVKTAQVRLSVRIVSLLPAVMVVLLSLISPDYQRGLMTAAGLGCVVVATVMDLTALAIIRHLMRGVL